MGHLPAFFCCFTTAPGRNGPSGATTPIGALIVYFAILFFFSMSRKAKSFGGNEWWY